MLDGKDNLIEMSLRLNKLTPNFQKCTKYQILKEDQDCGVKNNQESDHSATRRRPEQTFVFRVIYAVNFNFPLLT